MLTHRFYGRPQKVMPDTREQRRWAPKTANLPSSLPTSAPPRAKPEIDEIRQAATRENAHKACDDCLQLAAA